MTCVAQHAGNKTNLVNNTDTWVVVPAYNEGTAIGETLNDIRKVFSNIVVIDDCSTDQTATISKVHAHVCRHPVNLGQGAALQTGFEYVLAQGAGYIITFDADGQHRVSDAVAMLERIKHSDFDVLLASRFLGATVGMSQLKGIVLRLATVYTRWVTGLTLTDTHNGLRVFRGLAASKIRIRHNRMAHASEILEQIARLKMKYSEHPVTVIYTAYSKEKGQRLSGAFSVITDLFLGKLYR